MHFKVRIMNNIMFYVKVVTNFCCKLTYFAHLHFFTKKIKKFQNNPKKSNKYRFNDIYWIFKNCLISRKTKWIFGENDLIIKNIVIKGCILEIYRSVSGRNICSFYKEFFEMDFCDKKLRRRLNTNPTHK